MNHYIFIRVVLIIIYMLIRIVCFINGKEHGSEMEKREYWCGYGFLVFLVILVTCVICVDTIRKYNNQYNANRYNAMPIIINSEKI